MAGKNEVPALKGWRGKNTTLSDFIAAMTAAPTITVTKLTVLVTIITSLYCVW